MERKGFCGLNKGFLGGNILRKEDRNWAIEAKDLNDFGFDRVFSCKRDFKEFTLCK